MQLKIGKKYEAEITGITHEGIGVARINDIVVFIPNTLLDEKVIFRIDKVKKNFAFASLVEIKDKTSKRVNPPCNIYDLCGGCQLQHCEYSEQLKYKYDLVDNNLRRIGKLEDYKLMPVLGMENPWHYRNKAQFHVDIIDGKLRLGYFFSKSKNLIPINDCLLLTDDFIEIAKSIEELLNMDIDKYLSLKNVVIRKSFLNDEIMLIFISYKKDFNKYISLGKELIKDSKIVAVFYNYNPNRKTNLGFDFKLLEGKEKLIEGIDFLKFEISPLAFFQVNIKQTEVLYSKVLEFAGLSGNEVVYDLYCGTGTISLFLARNARKVYGIEEVEMSIVDAKKNAVLNGIDNVDFRAGKVEDLLPSLVREDGANVIVVDPPRQGCDSSVLELMASVKPKRIVYVSCNSSTLARDLNILEGYGYKTDIVQPVDMFPNTSHVECVILMQRSGSKDGK